jgi:hypothetical protein
VARASELKLGWPAFEVEVRAGGTAFELPGGPSVTPRDRWGF